MCTDLESKMLKKVSSAIARICFCATSGINPHTYGRRLGPGRVLGCNLGSHQPKISSKKNIRIYREAVGQGGRLSLSRAVADWRGEVTPLGQRVERSTGAKPLLETESYPTRSHCSRGEAGSIRGGGGGGDRERE
jgi:hypothetical protein